MAGERVGSDVGRNPDPTSTFVTKTDVTGETFINRNNTDSINPEKSRRGNKLTDYPDIQ